jgi:aminoglycoside phosphotransferase (APT) family kinase protein
LALSPEAERWIEHQSGGSIVQIEEQPRWRAHHFVTLNLGDETITLLARSARPPEVVKNSRVMQHFTLGREARVLEALQGHGLKIPRYYGYSDEHQIILMERLAGTNELSFARDDESRRLIMNEYYEQLAHLHSLDVEAMRNVLGEIDVPSRPEDIALAGKFRFMETDYLETRVGMRPEPLLELGRWWLHENVPQGRRVTFLQGDTGPGQFMFADDHLTGLIDWEMSHIGDPMLDLGVGRMRNMLYPTGPMREPLAHYEEVSPHPIDRQALQYYTVLSMLFTPLGTYKAAQRPVGRLLDTLPRLGWDVTLRRGLCDALAEALEMDLEPPELPLPPGNGGAPLLDFLTEHLEVHCLPIAHDPVERSKIEAAVAVARSLQLDSRVGHKLLSDDLDDMAKVLGHRPSDRTEGIEDLSRLVADQPESNVRELVWLFGRIERRREYLWRPLMVAQSSVPYEPLAPDLGRG